MQAEFETAFHLPDLSSPASLAPLVSRFAVTSKAMQTPPTAPSLLSVSSAPEMTLVVLFWGSEFSLELMTSLTIPGCPNLPVPLSTNHRTLGKECCDREINPKGTRVWAASCLLPAHGAGPSQRPWTLFVEGSVVSPL